MESTMKTLRMAGCVAGAILFAGAARADLMYAEGGTPTALAAYGDIGITFQVNTAISVTDLGFFGMSMGGGDTPWVQLWNDDTDTQLGVVNFSAGEAGSGWNDKALAAPIILMPGVNYQVQTTAYWVNEYPDDSSFTYGSAINASSVAFYNDAGFSGWGVNAAPSTTDAGAAPAMARLTYTIVPEPSVAVLTLLGLAGLMARRSLRVKLVC